MKLTIPDKSLLKKTGEVDYFTWNYQFPIKYVQLYRFETIVRLLGDKIYPTLLEVGTGSGIFIPELSKHCDNIFACDIHSEFENIHALCKQYNITRYDVSTQNIEQTNYPDGSFDVIVAVSVLEFVSDLPKAMAEISRLLKKDGLFITICPMESKILDFWLSLYTSKNPQEEFGASRQKVGKTIEENFDVLEKGYMMPLFGKLFPVYTHYKVKKKTV